MRTCTLCSAPYLARGFCRKHYLRWHRYSDPSIVLQRRGEPSADKDGYLIRWVNGRCVKEHRLIVERHLGRPLLPSEHVHHFNSKPTDNRIENLQVIGVREHGAMHANERWARHAGGA